MAKLLIPINNILYINSCNPWNNPMRKRWLLFPFYRWRYWTTEQLNNLCKVMRVLRDRHRILTQAVFPLSRDKPTVAGHVLVPALSRDHICISPRTYSKSPQDLFSPLATKGFAAPVQRLYPKLLNTAFAHTRWGPSECDHGILFCSQPHILAQALLSFYP